MNRDDIKLAVVLSLCVTMAVMGLSASKYADRCPNDHRRNPTSENRQNPQVDTPIRAFSKAPVDAPDAKRDEGNPCDNWWSIAQGVWPKADAWQAIFDLILIGVGLLQWRVYRQTYVSTHRPKLRVRNFYIEQVGGRNGTAPDFDGQFFVVNIGDTEARVIASHVLIDWRRGQLPMKRPYEGDTPNCKVVGGTLEAGASVPAKLDSSLIKQDIESITRSNGVNDPLRASVMGFVDDLDRAGSRRRTAFCRTYDRERERFIRSDNEDYEHEE